MEYPRKYHVVHIVSVLEVGGIQNLVLGMAKADPLSEWKHSVVCLLGARGELLKAYQDAGISVYSCRIHWPSRTRFLPGEIETFLRAQAEKTFPGRLARLLKFIRANIVHTHLPRRIDLLVHSVLELSQMPLVWTIHAQNLYFNESDTAILNIARDVLLRSGRGQITTDSTILAHSFLSHYPELTGISHVIHPGADTRHFECGIPKDSHWRRRFGIPENAILFGSCGRLAHVKGFDVLINAAARLIADGVDAHFAVSGKGDEFEKLSALITNCGIDDRFHLLGFQEDLAHTIKQFDVFILSSRSEGFPLSLIEALAAGLPCIATDISGVREMLDGQAGIVVEPESIQALKEAMVMMLDSSLRQSFSKAAAIQGRKFSFEHCSAQFAHLYSSLLR